MAVAPTVPVPMMRPGAPEWGWVSRQHSAEYGQLFRRAHDHHDAVVGDGSLRESGNQVTMIPDADDVQPGPFSKLGLARLDSGQWSVPG